MNLEVQDEFNCPICLDILLYPVKLSCGHVFCNYCLRTIKDSNPIKAQQSQQLLLKCPFCRKQQKIQAVNEQRQKEIMSQLLKQQNAIILNGKASTINHVDHNLTQSNRCIIIIKNNTIHGDVIWGSGTVHSSYVDQVGRLKGKVSIDNHGNIQFIELKCTYSNSPYQIWTGSLIYTYPKQYKSNHCQYQWFGWQRQSSGDLLLQLTKIN